jgi:hypothetical protein
MCLESHVVCRNHGATRRKGLGMGKVESEDLFRTECIPLRILRGSVF